ncbi:MAG: GNAT family N-acetyltransferase [Thermoanaerobaculia bacterium]|nr:GNAT family N-acetyltransferase [Thermoanaerobaculia bacterium]MCZ7650554.1 GNAT family N-acetyltransferase [Thermoanaerobaculia bacterium]
MAQPDFETVYAGYPRALEALPPARLEEGAYRVRYAGSAADLEAVLRLRFEVFNRELGEGLASSWETGRDEDEFDPFCHHLMVEHPASGAVIGTYRIQTAEMAAAGRGFYSGTEFDLAPLPAAVVADAVEVGRACIHRDHRLRPVLFLLWKGLALYMTHARKRYLFGPCSLTSQDPWVGKRALDRLQREGRMHPAIEVGALPGFECRWQGAPPSETAAEIELPPLFDMYLRYAGKVCGPPVIDRRFGTIDFLVLFDLQDLSPRARRMFFG